MPKRKDIHKITIIGSDPIVIGQTMREDVPPAFCRFIEPTYLSLRQGVE
ncbi:MAG: hypothetical protein PHF37_04005 [Phycisphaerae bacterium]|nr:hypothetical protein [Phycisphaerae bacterium]